MQVSVAPGVIDYWMISRRPLLPPAVGAVLRRRLVHFRGQYPGSQQAAQPPLMR